MLCDVLKAAGPPLRSLVQMARLRFEQPTWFLNRSSSDCRYLWRYALGQVNLPFDSSMPSPTRTRRFPIRCPCHGLSPPRSQPSPLSPPALLMIATEEAVNPTPNARPRPTIRTATPKPALLKSLYANPAMLIAASARDPVATSRSPTARRMSLRAVHPPPMPSSGSMSPASSGLRPVTNWSSCASNSSTRPANPSPPTPSPHPCGSRAWRTSSCPASRVWIEAGCGQPCQHRRSDATYDEVQPPCAVTLESRFDGIHRGHQPRHQE